VNFDISVAFAAQPVPGGIAIESAAILAQQFRFIDLNTGLLTSFYHDVSVSMNV